MKNHFITILTLSTLIIFVCPGHDLEAKDTNQAAQILCDYGKGLYDSGDFENAIHEFSKALLIEPENQMARSYLEKMGLDKGIYAGNRSSLTQVGEISRRLISHQQKIAYLKEQKKKSDATMKRIQEEQQRLANVIAKKEEALKNSRERIASLSREAREGTIEDQAKIKALSKDVDAKKSELQEQKKLSSKQLKELSLQQLSLYNKQVELEDLRKIARGAQERNQDEDLKLARQIEKLTAEVTRRETQVMALQEKLKTAQETTAPPENQYVNNEDRLIEYIQKYNSSEAAICALRSEYKEKITGLENEIDRLKSDTNRSAIDKQTAVDSLEVALIEAKEKESSLNEQIALLELATPVTRDELVMAKTREINEKEKLLKEKDETIKSLANELAQMENQIGKEPAESEEYQDGDDEEGNAEEEPPADEINKENDANSNAGFAELIKQKDDSIADLKEKLAAAHKELNALAKLSKSDVPNADSSGTEGPSDHKETPSGGSENQLFEQDVIIKEKEEDISKLKKQLADMEERLNLNQRIIREKEDQIRALNEDFKRLLEEEANKPESQ